MMYCCDPEYYIKELEHRPGKCMIVQRTRITGLHVQIEHFLHGSQPNPEATFVADVMELGTLELFLKLHDHLAREHDYWEHGIMGVLDE